MVQSYRSGCSLRQVARRFHVPVSHVQRWVRRANGLRLDRVDWRDLPRGLRRPANRTEASVETLVLGLRRHLRDQSDLGECGASAIHRELLDRGQTHPPSICTIGRILKRHGALDGRQRIRRPSPPRGWYLSDVAAGLAELDEFDFVEGLFIQGGTEVEVLNGISLHGGLTVSFPDSPFTSKITLERLLSHWREVGLPDYVQFDNDTVFQGTHRVPDTLGRVTRVCLSLGMTVVFTPPREPGFQAAIENYNGLWQAKVWARFHHDTMADLQERSKRYVIAHRRCSAARRDGTPERRPFPADWCRDLQAKPRGRIIYLRRSDDLGVVNLMGRTYLTDKARPHRLVKIVVDLVQDSMSFYALRRRDPLCQPLLRTIHYAFPNRRFKE